MVCISPAGSVTLPMQRSIGGSDHLQNLPLSKSLTLDLDRKTILKNIGEDSTVELASNPFYAESKLVQEYRALFAVTLECVAYSSSSSNHPGELLATGVTLVHCIPAIRRVFYFFFICVLLASSTLEDVKGASGEECFRAIKSCDLENHFIFISCSYSVSYEI